MQTLTPSPYATLQASQHQRVSDGHTVPLLEDCDPERRLLVLVWSQLGDFDSLEYAGWIQRDRDRLAAAQVEVRAVGIGDRGSVDILPDLKARGFPSKSANFVADLLDGLPP